MKERSRHGVAQWLCPIYNMDTSVPGSLSIDSVRVCDRSIHPCVAAKGLTPSPSVIDIIVNHSPLPPHTQLG